MSHFEIRFPDDISYGSSGGPVFSTDVIVMKSGKESRLMNRPDPLCEFEVSEGVKTLAQAQNLISFFRAIGKGKANTFRYKDWTDFAATVANGVLGSGVGAGTPTLQCYKVYSQSGENVLRKLEKLVSGTFSYYRNAVLQTNPTHYTIDLNTGIVTFVADDSEAITGHTVGASHQFTTANDITGLAIGKKVYLLGLTVSGGTDVLNGVAHTITGKSGSGPYTWTVSTATTGLTVSGGTAYSYPQASDTLTLATEFDVRCRFDIDKLVLVYDEFDNLSSQIPVVEVPA